MILLIIVFLKLSVGYITYDTNVYQGLDNLITSGFTCLNNIKTAQQVFLEPLQMFLKQFQLLINMMWKKLQDFSSQLLVSLFQDFQLNQNVLQKECLNIISGGMQQMTLELKQLIALTKYHSNQNYFTFKSKCTLRICFNYKFLNDRNFKFYFIYNIYHRYKCNCQFITNLNTIGYQIILGLDSSFGSTTLKSFTSAYTSPSIRIEKNKFFLLPLCGFNYADNDNIRLQKTYTITGDNLVYSLYDWSGSYISNYHLEVQIPLDYITISRAIKASHLQITAFEDYSQTLCSNFQIKIYESNQIFESIGTFQTEIVDTTNIINIDVLIQCSQNYKIKAKLNYCGTCSNQGRYELERSCYGSINRYKFRTRFQTSFLAKKQLTITISQQSLKITQLVYTETQISVQTELNIISMTLSNV